MSDPSGTATRVPSDGDQPTKRGFGGALAFQLRQSGKAWLFVTPVLITLAVVVGYPVFRAIYMSFQKDAGLDPATKRRRD